ncbi:Rieske (2Fe-2S) protein [Roseococcus sp. SYP-B2431]|uniref:Rieske (2Fe-2S) protein n=1 Tax=Roseococcus sp. SYP-B2431 TaxID=2496640 RepID=UPI0010395922|nr:Rieske (2Fe-2S) protein [Roseococcus sp. SYP-B2431]TCH96816.1 Rieske (2Fe-2S) protein [Roseococcus sp. SYP-B2431]
MSDWRTLCRLEDLPEGESRGFDAPPGGFTGLFAIRRGERVLVYVNSCPHVGLPLELVPHRFLDRKGERIVCAAHGARFRIEDGECISGPCIGEVLEAVPVRIEGAEVRVPRDAGQ